MMALVILIQIVIDFAADFCAGLHIGVEGIVRGTYFGVVFCCFYCMEFETGMSKTHLRVMFLVLLTCMIHAGAVAVYPTTTLFILSITVVPSFNIFLK